MPFNKDHYIILSTTEYKNYTYIEAEYDWEPTRCPKEGCDSCFFENQGESSIASHKIYMKRDRKGVVYNARRRRFKCRMCGTSFAADAEETAEWGSDFSPLYRNTVINYWLTSQTKSIYACSKRYGVDRSNITEWEDNLADAFYDVQQIEGYEELYFGQFHCYKDPQLHAFLVETEEEYGGLVGFIRDYSADGFFGVEKKRFINTKKVKCVRYDAVPGLETQLRELFPNATLIANPEKMVRVIDKDNDPKWMVLSEKVRTHVDIRVEKKHRFSSIMLQMMYNNERWKQKVREAGTQAGFSIQEFGGSWTPQTQKIHRFDGNEKISWFEIPDDLIDEYDQEDNID